MLVQNIMAKEKIDIIELGKYSVCSNIDDLISKYSTADVPSSETILKWFKMYYKKTIATVQVYISKEEVYHYVFEAFLFLTFPEFEYFLLDFSHFSRNFSINKKPRKSLPHKAFRDFDFRQIFRNRLRMCGSAYFSL